MPSNFVRTALRLIDASACIFGMVLLFSCGPEKYLEPDENVLYANYFTINMQDGSPVTKDVKQAATSKDNYIKQTPNRRLLGLDRTTMHIYCLSSPTDSSWWGRSLRNTGEPPVIYNPAEASRSVRELEEMMASKGCFNTTADFDTLKIKNRNITIRYNIHASPRYRIDSISYSCADTNIKPLLSQWGKESPLRVGDYYDQEVIVAERSRIVNRLQEDGYFMATEDLVQFYIDTTLPGHRLSIDIVVRTPIHTIGDSIIREPLQKYYFNNITIDSNAVSESVIRRILNIVPGNLYRPSDVSATYNSLLNIHNFNYIDIQLNESPLSTSEKRLLDADIHLRNTTKQNFSASLELSNASPITPSDSGNFITNGNLGVETVLSYQHKNLFGGAELFKLEGNLLLEFSKRLFRKSSHFDASLFSTLETGLKATIDLPVFLLPFSNKISRRITLPHTTFSVGGNYQFRSDFERYQFNTAFGYNWNIDNRSYHQVFPLELTYVRVTNIGDDYWNRIIHYIDQRIAYQLSDHFILGARYDFVHSNQQLGSRTNFTYIHATAETAGNLLKLISNQHPEWQDEFGQNLIFEVPYSQYVRTTAEIKRYIYHGHKSTLVLRFLAGIGIPYGNSLSMPYEKSFFGGGPTSIRAWQIRRLGPGSSPFNNEFIYDRIGDMTLVANIEERFPIFGPIEGAIFADMGNIWAKEEYYPGDPEAFHWNSFYKEIALGTGIGLRLKIYILTLRLDFAIPVYDPCNTTDKWRPKHWKFDQIVTNFGIDYPF